MQNCVMLYCLISKEGSVGRLLMPFYFSNVERLRLFSRRILCQCFFLRRLDKQSLFLARSLFRQGQYFFWRFFELFSEFWLRS